jgi:hypothetical protein
MKYDASASRAELRGRAVVGPQKGCLRFRRRQTLQRRQLVVIRSQRRYVSLGIHHDGELLMTESSLVCPTNLLRYWMYKIEAGCYDSL